MVASLQSLSQLGSTMHVIADICVVPITGRVSVRDEVKIAYDILRATGLPVHLHAYGTNIEGDYDAVFLALKRVHQTLHRNGVQRISTTIRVGSRTDKEQTIKDKVDAVMNTEKLADVIPIEEAKA